MQILAHRKTTQHHYRLQIRHREEPTGWVPQSVVNKFWSTARLENWRREQAIDADAKRAKALLGATAQQPGLDNAKHRKKLGLEVYPLDTPIYKVFVNKHGLDQEFKGKVVGYNKRRKWFRIRYSDGDEEELTHTQVRKHLYPTAWHDTNEDMDELEEYDLNLWDEADTGEQ